MKMPPLIRKFTSISFFIILMTVIGPSIGLGQLSPDPATDSLNAEIRALAKRHVDGKAGMQSSLAIKLFINKSANLQEKGIVEIYEQEYIKIQRSKKITTPLDFFKNPITILIAIALFILGTLVRSIRSTLTRWLGMFWDNIYARLAGTRLFRRVALKNYLKSVQNTFRKIHIPFRPDRPLEMADIYVPLKVSGMGLGEEQDALAFSQSNSRLVIKGPPGSGKSMLLKQLALFYSSLAKSKRRSSKLPIYFELHRLNTPELTIHKGLEVVFERNEFPKSKHFLSQGLENGRFLILLDGLDEVTDQERGRVVQSIKDFIDKYPTCNYLITCRSAVYNGVFDAKMSQTLDVVEFNDQQIWTFLRAWEKDLPPTKPIAQLIASLRDRPNIKALARNPLLLTIIAHLFSDIEHFILPHSRAEFYHQSTDILLQRWQKEWNKYPSPKNDWFFKG